MADGSSCANSCAKCKVTRYCSRDCQKKDWKTHKKVCSKLAAGASNIDTEHGGADSTLKGVEKHVPDPFTRLDKGTYLHDRPETDVFKLLIDSFRMRQADDFNFENKATPRSLYTGATSSIEPFRKYLDKAAAQPECAKFGESGAWSDLRKKVTKQEISQHYGNDRMPMQMRMLAEAVYGCGTMGQDGSGIRKLMMQAESGGSEDSQFMSMFSIGH
ncbi:hypothetical protein CC80DRAFT_528067 [Byssothecium circinans]|uniref:MYND-type domain-containing protein n=1 Tax=Byssothecium circinans TaxID=147558 RepID=A0A6A5THL1_9PLEO|nr:hypothetical protein CC80DRAFT_528067 [Byssothecium circinans]